MKRLNAPMAAYCLRAALAAEVARDDLVMHFARLRTIGMGRPILPQSDLEDAFVWVSITCTEVPPCPIQEHAGTSRPRKKSPSSYAISSKASLSPKSATTSSQPHPLLSLCTFPKNLTLGHQLEQGTTEGS
jgi:hypothetical protein